MNRFELKNLIIVLYMPSHDRYFYIPAGVIGDTCICPYRCSPLITCCSAIAKAEESGLGADFTISIGRSSERPWTICDMADGY